MVVECRAVRVVFLVVLGLIPICTSAKSHETAADLQQRIDSDQNPVKKAKDEVKLAELKLDDVKGEYSAGRIDSGQKVLGTFVDEMKTSWKLLQDSGRKAPRQPDGFKELEIALRENERILQDLARTVSYFDRAPIMKAVMDLDQMRNEVLQAQFPPSTPHGHKDSAPPPPSPGPPADSR
jgi:hypothetical protein